MITTMFPQSNSHLVPALQTVRRKNTRQLRDIGHKALNFVILLIYLVTSLTLAPAAAKQQLQCDKTVLLLYLDLTVYSVCIHFLHPKNNDISYTGFCCLNLSVISGIAIII